jgi:calcineurin-like phosphoesterase family protein
MDRLEMNLQLTRNDNHTIMLSHYPTATMMYTRSSSGTTFAELSTRFSVYLCGHLHKLVCGKYVKMMIL